MGWSSVLETALPRSHVVQFYGKDDRFFVRNAARYLSEGLKRRQGLLVVATPAHAQAFVLQLASADASSPDALQQGRIAFLDAQATLDQIMVGPEPDPVRFRAVIGAAVRQAKLRAGSRSVRAYGEMVGLLWTAGQVSAAIKLEQCWNELLESEGCSLFCGYPIDLFGPEFERSEVDAIMCAHSHFVPADREAEAAIDTAIGEVLGPRADSIRLLLRSAFLSWDTIPRVEVIALWLRRNLPEHADTILGRARTHAAGTHAVIS
jgi:MEDS: MEthanogen/methylotroph, DcmR Sensory domain